MADNDFLDASFLAAVQSAGARARVETLMAGVPVFYLDTKSNLDIMEQPDGRRYEIRFLAGEPRDCNYQVVRELAKAIA